MARLASHLDEENVIMILQLQEKASVKRILEYRGQEIISWELLD